MNGVRKYYGTDPRTEKKHARYNNINSYIEFLHVKFDRTRQILPGRFYVYNYRFDKDSAPWEEIKFWDFSPLTYVFRTLGKRFYGLNFHHMPVRPRLLWLNRLEKLAGSKRFNDPRTVKAPRLTYPRMLLIPKSKIGIRQYLYNRVWDLRAVPTSQVREALRYYGSTQWGVTINQVHSRYLSYDPRPKRR